MTHGDDDHDWAGEDGAPGEDQAAESLRSVAELGARTRLARSGHWFVLAVFGVVVLGAMPFYVLTFATASTPGCQAFHGGVSCRFHDVTPGPLGGAFNPLFSPFSLDRWATVYWAVAMVVGFAAVVAFYRQRARAVGVQGRIWPMVVVGLGLLGAVLIVDNGPRYFPNFPDLWIRGTGALVILAVGIAVLAALERSRGFGLFAASFFGLALLSCLYDDVNLFYRVGIGSPFAGGGNALPNLLVPGIYLLLGGLGFWLGGRRARRPTVSPR
jgi:hypothetical protein